MFTENEGFILIANAIFKIGQQCAPAEIYDMAEELPKSTCVTTALANLAGQARAQFLDEEYSSHVAHFGACTTDGLKSKLTGKKYYDPCITYLVEISRGMMERPGLVMRSRILLLEEHSGAEDGSNIRRTLTNALKAKYNLNFEKFYQKFCFVTDRASNMPTENMSYLTKGELSAEEGVAFQRFSASASVIPTFAQLSLLGSFRCPIKPLERLLSDPIRTYPKRLILRIGNVVK